MQIKSKSQLVDCADTENKVPFYSAFLTNFHWERAKGKVLSKYRKPALRPVKVSPPECLTNKWEWCRWIKNFVFQILCDTSGCVFSLKSAGKNLKSPFFWKN